MYSPFLFASSVIIFLCTLITTFPVSHIVGLESPFAERCGSFRVPFPFSSSTGPLSRIFNVSCLNSSTPFLQIGPRSYRILDFFPDGVLVTFPGPATNACRQYNDLNSFGFAGNEYFGISQDNIIGLYDCEDSSLCKASCETVDLPSCSNATAPPACCYPLSDHSMWHTGDGFSAFSKYGCRGFSSWVVQRGSTTGTQGVKLEWAIPRNSSNSTCAGNADTVNATSIREGLRCSCKDGFIGDGFASGAGCLKSCVRDGQAASGKVCYTKARVERKFRVIAGIVAPAVVVISMLALFCLLRKPGKSGSQFCRVVSFQKGSRTRMFTYQELQEATGGGFQYGQELAQCRRGTIYHGILGDGSQVLVHKIQCQTNEELVPVLDRIKALSAIVHMHMARIVGCYIEPDHPPLIVYEYPTNGLLNEYLRRGDPDRIRLDWCTRMSIAAETVKTLAFLQCEISPPIFHRELRSSYILLDEDFTVKIFGFELLTSGLPETDQRSDVYNLGLLLLEIISGSTEQGPPNLSIALQKIRNGMLEEIVDPILEYHEQPPSCREQIETVADIATRCLLFGGEGRLSMADVTKELVQVAKDNHRRGPALEETFSNSSLLQMISMSPDSVYAPRPESHY
ncbi:probably inactive receptor-like protein kinase At2g46850 [Punica granatum]|uniref:Protein kinase domain-containing protein n=2 Tax=Punica granatum TaxID=22663 RepID=A0A218W747_PUNGR|nr:probably inactive receptor-like protein kinase At2g46850 [Punica granatum]OWM68605.1 hypothetical protein CDL15_Pgr023570 [Punica granatum]PKI78981.1 hypothetical protein CRG98_000622 [Punica granatum]